MNMFRLVIWFLLIFYLPEMDARHNFTKNLTHYVPIDTRTDRIVKCIAKLSETITEPYNLIMVDVQWRKKGFKNIWKFRNVSTILYTGHDSLQKIVKYKRLNNFMLLLDNIASFQQWIVDVRTFNFWNPKANFLIALLDRENATEVLELAWKYYIVNINIILLFDMVPLVYTYYPFKNVDCVNPVMPELVMTCDQELPHTLFPKKIPRTYRGCDVRLLVYKLPPFVLNVSGNANNVSDVGLEVIIVKTLAKVLNFTEVYVPHNFTSWGNRLPNGSYSQMLGAMYHRQADVMFGVVPYTAISIDFDFTIMHIIEGITWWVPVAREEPGWKNLLLVFQPIVWIGCWSSFGISAVTWWVIGRTRERSRHFSTLMGTVVANLCIGLQVVVPQPRSNVMRYLFMGTTLYSMLMNTAHQSQLIGSLTTPRYERQITNLDELLESHLSYGFNSTIEFYFARSTNKQYQTVAANYIKCPMTEECLNRTAFKRDFAVMKNIRQTMYMINKYYTKPDGTSMIYGFKDVYVFFPKFVMAKGFPMLDQFDQLIMQLHSNGLLAKWDKEVTGTHKIKSTGTVTQPLTMSHLASGFLYILIGYLVSCIAFIIEIVHYKWQSRRKNLFRRK